MACNNSATPLLLPWTNVTVSSDQLASFRGIKFGIGTPPQPFALVPSIGDDNLWVFDISTCNSTFDDQCIGSRGGAYDPGDSSTYRNFSLSAWNGSHSADTNGTYEFFDDNLQFSDTTVPGFPIILNYEPANNEAGLPLGPESVFLSAAVDSGVAPSRSWGLWTGSRSVTDPTDGLLVVGGFDRARFTQQLTSFNSRLDCSTCLFVNNLTYVDENGSTPLFANSSETLDIGLEPYVHVLELPQGVFEAFAKASNGTYDPFQQLLTYSPLAPPTGNLSVSLSASDGSNYEVTIPASELFTFPRLFDAEGQYSISNDTIMIAEVLNDTVPEYVAAWGIPFLTMNYLVMDYHYNQFFMAPAIRGNITSHIQPLCTGIAGGTPSPTSTAKPTSSSAHPPPPPHPSHTGAIVGGVVGGVIGLCLLGALIFFLGRRRKPEPEQPARVAVAPIEEPSTKNELPSPSSERAPGMTEKQPFPYEKETFRELPSNEPTSPMSYELPAENLRS